MAELVADCPRCGAQRMTFETGGQLHVRTDYGWKAHYEVFGVCRACFKSTTFHLALNSPNHAREFDLDEVFKKRVALNPIFDVLGYLSLKDRAAVRPPEHLPEPVRAAFEEGAKCAAIGCHNAAAAMFRLALDLATEPLLPGEDAPEPGKRVRRDLGLRLGWLFQSGKLPADLRALSDCVREDGNDGAHRGNVTKEDAEDLQDFSLELLERMFSEPAKLEAAKLRREARRAAVKG